MLAETATVLDDDRAGPPLAGATMRLRPVEAGSVHRLMPTATADELVDLRSLDPGACRAVVDRLGERSGAIVVAIRRDQIDDLAIDLLGANILLLSDPDDAECTIALATARAVNGGSRVAERDRNADRIKQLNEEVARIAETLARLSARSGTDADPSIRDAAPNRSVRPADADIDAADIRRTIRARRLRGEVFGIHGLFEDPAWDILLDLFAARLEHRQVSVSSLCIAAAVAPTTGLRWIGRLVDAGLLERRPDQFDRRRAFIVLAERAADAMLRYVAMVRRAGLPLV